MAINFPNSPATNEVFTTGATGPAWVYDGAVWNLVSTANDGIEAAIAAEVTARNAADAVVTDAFTAADVVVTDASVAADVVVTDAFTAADVVVTDAFTAADALLLTNPLTTKGDIVIQDTSAATRLAKGTEGQYLVMGGSDLPVWGDGLVINEAGADVDFRVESDTDTHALFVRGSDGRVALGAGIQGGTHNTHEIVIDDATSFVTSIPGGSGFYPQSSDTLAIGNEDGTTLGGYTSLHMTRLGSGGAAAAKIALSNNAAGSGRLSFMMRDSTHTASIDEKMYIDTVGVRINPLGTDRDLQVESDTDTHALFVQGSDGFVGINESTPEFRLDLVGDAVAGAAGDTSVASFSSNSDQRVFLKVKNNYAQDTAWAPRAGLDLEVTDHLNSPNKMRAWLELQQRTATGGQGQASLSVPLDFSIYVNNVGTVTSSSGEMASSSVIPGTEILTLDSTAVTFNDPGNDVDFRVESDTDTHALFVQGSDGKVGIGDSAPLGNLHVTSGSSGLGTVNSSGDELILESAGNTGMTLMSPNTGYQYVMFADANSNTAASIRYAHPTDKFSFYVQGTSYLDVSATTTVINDAGADHDFRVESDTETHALFLEGSSGHIGIGNSTPLSPLDIKIATGDSGGSSGIRMTTVDGGGMALYPATAVANPVWTFAANSGETFAWRPHGTACMALDYGLTLGAPTGGQKGLGTLNAVNVYDDNTLLTDFVLDQAVDGEIDFEFYDNLELGGAAAREWDPRNLDIDHYEEKWKERKALPSFRSREERFDDDGNEIRDSLGTLVQGLQQELETAMVHIANLNARLKQLEG